MIIESIIGWVIAAAVLRNMYATFRHRSHKASAGIVSLSLFALAFFAMWHHDTIHYVLRVAWAIFWAWIWWLGGGGDDFKRGKKKLIEKVTALASGRLGVEPA